LIKKFSFFSFVPFISSRIETVVIGFIARNPGETATPDPKSAALVLVINDIASDPRHTSPESAIGAVTSTEAGGAADVPPQGRVST